MGFEKDVEAGNERAHGGHHDGDTPRIGQSISGDAKVGIGADTPQIEPKNTYLSPPPSQNPISRIISSRSAASFDPGPPPDGGVTAWTQAIMAHFVIFTTWGYLNSYGVFQTYFTTALGHPPSDISWIGRLNSISSYVTRTKSSYDAHLGSLQPCISTQPCKSELRAAYGKDSHVQTLFNI